MAGPITRMTLQQEIECPVSFEPLIAAVFLVPCCHKINEGVAQKIFGGMKGESVYAARPCPICRTIVWAYYPYYVMRSLVAAVLKEKPSVEKSGSSSDTDRLPQDKAAEDLKIEDCARTRAQAGDVAGALECVNLFDPGSRVRRRVFTDVAVAVAEHVAIGEALEIIASCGCEATKNAALKGIAEMLANRGMYKTAFDIMERISAAYVSNLTCCSIVSIMEKRGDQPKVNEKIADMFGVVLS